METRAEYTAQAPLAISEQRETYIRADGSTFTRSDIFVKLAVTFRDTMLAQLKGPPLSVYLCIALHCGDAGMTAYPSVNTICRETGYGHTAVIKATHKLAEMGLITVTHRMTEAGDQDSNLYHINGYATMGEGSTPSVPRVVHLVNQGSTPSVPKEESIKEESNQEEEEGATAPLAPADDWPDEPFQKEEEPPTENPAQVQRERMRDKFGPDWLSAGAHCQEAQEAEGAWTVPRHRGLSSQCAAYRRVYGFSPKSYQRQSIDECVSDAEESLQLWEKVCRAWADVGWNPFNVQGMLQHYTEGRLPSTKPKGGNGRHDPRSLEERAEYVHTEENPNPLNVRFLSVEETERLTREYAEQQAANVPGL